MGLSMHDRYYEPEDDNEGDLLADRITELLNSKYDITKSFSLFAEGISECSKADEESILTILNGDINSIDFTQLGRKLWDVAFSYSEQLAENHAVEDLTRGNLD